uniref:Putative ovule protein n=1 Tax=Solanum chacoense TaxID=4108 RepID=A0A0V0GV42_SOLCH
MPRNINKKRQILARMSKKQSTSSQKMINLARTYKQHKEPRIPFWVTQFIKKPTKSNTRTPKISSRITSSGR